MKKVLTSLIVVLTAARLQAQTPVEDMPKLVVGITIDQLRTDYLEMMQQAFTEKGFKRLLNGGIVYENVIFGFPGTGKAPSTACIYTGTTPYYNGIIGDTYYNPVTRRVESILFDSEKMGNYTSETVSPKNLLTSTICDELKIASNGLSDIFAVAPSYEQAIIGGGHAANAAFWIDDTNGKWATTTYYKDIPWYVEQYNTVSSLSGRIDTIQWNPLKPLQTYTGFRYLSPDFTFRYLFSKSREACYRHFKESGLVNEEVNRLVETFFKYGTLGQRQYPDFLAIGYSTANFRNKTIQEGSLEMQDIYLRLDRDLGKLLDLIDQKVGLKNTLVFLTSTGHFNGEGKEPGSFNVPSGEFYPNRAVALLNMYLMALYGQSNWVEGYHDRQIYLNRKLITDQGIGMDEIQTKAAEFIIQMTGIQDVITSHQLLHGNWNGRLDRMRKGFHRKLSGDLLLEIQPGWEIVYEDAASTREYVRNNFIPAPLIFFGWNLKPERIRREIQAEQIAPTVSHILRIRSPNAAAAQALPELR